MEAETATAPRTRKPLSDCTNTDASLQSSSSKTKRKLASASKKSLTRSKPGSKTPSSDNSTNHGHDLNPSSTPEPTIVSTAQKVSSVDGTGDDVFKVNTVYSRRQNSPKRKNKGKEVASSFSSTPTPETLNKNKGKEVASSFSSTPMPKTLNKGKSVVVEHMDLRKSLTEPCTKKQRSWSSEEDLSKNPALQEFIKKQQAYFKEIDEFELLEEDV